MKKTISLALIIIHIVCITVYACKTEYPEYLLKMIENYPETKPIIEYYDEIRGDAHYFEGKIDISQDLTTDGVPLFLQWDKRWAFLNYGKETVIATSGCGPVCLSMIMCYYTKDSTKNPFEIAKFSNENGYYTENIGTVDTLFTEGADKLGLSSIKLPVEPNLAKEFLECDIMIVALMNAGIFTRSGHYIVIRGYDDDGYFYVNDPNSLIKSKRAWHKDIIFPEIRKLWAVYK